MIETADINEIKVASVDSANIQAATLRGYQARRMKNDPNRAFSYAGGLCISIMMEKPGARSLCMRCWHKCDRRMDLSHMKLISNALASKPELKKYLITYEIVEKLIRVDGKVIPGLIMDWLDGKTLGQYVVDESGTTAAQIRAVAEKFREMCADLNRARFVHGDLSSGNVMVLPDGSLKLIDYDTVYVESMGAQPQMITGDVACQHPGRSAHGRAELYADYFSQHIIYVSLLMMARDSSLRPEESKNLVFLQPDIKDAATFRSTPAFRKGMAMNDPAIREELEYIAKALAGKYEQVKPLAAPGFTETPKPAPKPETAKPTLHTVAATYCTNCGQRFQRSDYEFCTACGAPRFKYTVKS